MTKPVASFFSTIGHPFLLLPLVLTFLMAQKVPLVAAVPTILSIVGCLAFMGVFLYFRKKRGIISNLDVSVRQERSRNIYRPILALIGAVSVILYIFEQPFVRETLFFGLLMAVCYAINAKLKISQHTVVASYLGGLLFSVGAAWGIGMLALAALVAWSRVALGRHEKNEVQWGALVGTAFGLAQIWLLP